MPSLKDLRTRITTVKSTQKITRAMQMVAASKLRRAQTAVESARHFSERMELLLANLAASRSESAESEASRLLVGSGNDRTHLLVVCTGERGLCGAFNTSIVRLARDHVHSLITAGKAVKILCIGKKGYDQLKRTHGQQIVELIDLRAVRSIGHETVKPIAEKILSMFQRGEYDVCNVFYARFRSVLSQIPTVQPLVPAFDATVQEQAVSFYDYEPEAEELLSQCLPQVITTRIYQALLENTASFFGAQIGAMDNATRNAGDMAKKYTLRYNRTRQAMITKELIEIISGAEAL